MKKIIIIFTLLYLSITNAYGCSCAWWATPYESYQSADTVFIGKVTSIETIEDTSTDVLPKKTGEFNFYLAYDSKYITSFEVINHIKGNQNDIIQIHTQWNGASCGRNFDLNTEYFVYAYWNDNTLTTSLCDRTNELKYAVDDINSLRILINNDWSYTLLFVLIYKKYIISIIILLLIWWICILYKNKIITEIRSWKNK